MHRGRDQQRMSEKAACSCIGALCVVCSLSGACAALTAVPAWLVALAGSIAIALVWRDVLRQRDASAIAGAVAGAALGLLLPAAPLAIADIVAHPVGVGSSGDLLALMDCIDRDPASVIGHRAVVTGEWTPRAAGRDATVSQRIISCCAADAIDVGFDVEPMVAVKIAERSRVRVTGVVSEQMRDGEVRFAMVKARVAPLRDSGAAAQ
jgi:hypothetical protein